MTLLEASIDADSMIEAAYQRLEETPYQPMTAPAPAAGLQDPRAVSPET
jgi:hypothetical protein